MYIRTVRVHKVMSEVLYKCLLNKMEENHADNFESSSIISDVQEKVNDFYENITQCSNHDFIEKDCSNYKLYLEDSLGILPDTLLQTIDIKWKILDTFACRSTRPRNKPSRGLSRTEFFGPIIRD